MNLKKILNTNSIYSQYFFSFLLITLTTYLSFIVRAQIDYHSIGYFYLINVLLVSAFYTKRAILFSAIFSALAWNFFFMSPKYSFSIGSTQDFIMFLTYFFIALLGGWLNEKIHQHKKLLAIRTESERLYQTLLNSISHEIRTPLTSIIGNISALQNSELSENKSYLKLTTSELLLASNRLNQVVENLLDMTRIESGHLKLKNEVFSMSELIEFTVARFKFISKNSILIQNKSNEDFSDLILGDFKLLDLAIGNILLNAIQYSPEGSQIIVSLFPKSESIFLTISDSGPGIPAEFKNKIFDKFFRLPGTPSGGTGLGLSVVKGILDAHSSKIQLLDSNQGAFFQIEFSKVTLPENIKGSLQ